MEPFLHNTRGVLDSAPLAMSAFSALRADGIVLRVMVDEVPDKRKEVEAHPVVDCLMIDFRNKAASQLLVELLGEDEAQMLMKDWMGNAKFKEVVGRLTHVSLILDSNNKSRDWKYASGAATTQSVELDASKMKFANDTQATLVCACLVNKARRVGLDLTKETSSWSREQYAAIRKLEEGELIILKKLREGSIRTQSGALAIYEYGSLRAEFFSDGANPFDFAFGSFK